MAKLTPDYINWVLTLNASQAQEEFHKLEKANRELQKQTNASRKAMADLEARGQKGSAEWDNLRKSIEQNSRAMSRNRARMDELAKRFDLTSMSVNQLKKRLKDLQREFNSTSKATDPKRYKELQQEINKTQQALYQATGQTDKLKNGFLSLTKMKQTIIGFFTAIGMTVLNLVIGSFRNAFNIVVDFEKANSKLAGILGTTREGIKELEAAARQLGATTSYSAAEVTNLQIELAKLGFSKEQIIQMEAGVLKFAKAVDTDLARASAFAGAALRIFGKDAKDTEDVLATFAVATTKTSLDFSKLEASLATVGPVAHAFGLSIEDTVALLGMLANAGFDASSAATATRNIILNLSDANGDLAKALGGPVRNAADLAAGLQKLNAEGVDLAKALELTDKRSVAAFSTFLSQAQNITALRDSITGVTEDFNHMSETMGNNVAGAMAGLRSAAEELVLKISEGTEGPIKEMIQMLTSLVRKVGEVYEWLSRFGGAIKTVVVALVSYRLALKAALLVKNLFLGTLRAGRALIAAFRAAMLLLNTSFKAMVVGVRGATTSMQALKAALMSTPWTAVLGAIAAVVAVIMTWKSSNEGLAESIEEVNEAEEEMKRQAEEHAGKRREFTEKLAAEKARLLELVKVAENENLSKERRLKAIKEINRICPEYNGHLDAERGRLRANKKALDDYIASMEKRMRLAYYKDEYQQYIRENEAARARQRKAKAQWEEHKNDWVEDDRTYTGQAYAGPVPLPWNTTQGSVVRVRRHSQRHGNTMRMELDAANRAAEDTQTALEDFRKDMKAAGFEIEDVFTSGEEAVTATTGKMASGMRSAASATHAAVDQLKELRRELKELRKAEPETDEELQAIESRKTVLRERIRALTKGPKKTKSKKKNTRTPGTYGEDSLDEATADADDLHQRNLLAVNKLKGSIPDYELVIKKNEELIRYCGDLLKALDDLRKSTDATHAKTLDKIRARENEVAQQMLGARQAINAATARKEQADHDSRLKAWQAFYDRQELSMKRWVANREITEGEAEIYLLAQSKSLHQSQLKELQDYYAKTQTADYLGAEERRQLLDKLSADIRSMQGQVLTDTGKWSELLREMMTDTQSAAGIKNVYEQQRRELEATYRVMMGFTQKGSEEEAALKAEKLRRLSALDYQYQEQVWQLQELTGLSWGQQYDRELARLENYHRRGLVDEKDYQRKKLELQVNNAKKYFDFYAGLAGSTFTALQDAEIAKSDAKYDVLIQQARNNGEDTAALEEEKENKKLEIQKKYADVNFAIKVSQIIADTAVSIMKAFADLGPIGGAVAAAMLTATGAAQVISAKAERDKIKHMSPSHTSGAASTGADATAQRVLTGYSEGGYTGDGGRYEVAGLVHRGEYVVPKPIMTHPRVIDAVGTIEAIRRSKALPAPRHPAASGAGSGFAEGGFTGPSADFGELRETARELKEALGNIRAYVVYKDIERARDNTARARAPFTRK